MILKIVVYVPKRLIAEIKDVRRESATGNGPKVLFPIKNSSADLFPLSVATAPIPREMSNMAPKKQ